MSLKGYAIARGRETPGADRGLSISVVSSTIARIEGIVAALHDIDKDRAIRSGLMIMGRVFVSGGKSRLKVRLKDKKGVTGNLYSAFKIRVKRREAGMLVGFDKKGHHSHLVDMGTQRRYTEAGRDQGVMPANSFWTDTAKEDWRKATDSLFAGLERAVNRIIERNAY